MYNDLFAYLGEKDVKYEGYIKFSNRSSVRIGGIVDVGVFPDTKDKLISVLKYLYTNGYHFCIVGKMTNLLADDSSYNGVAVFTTEIKEYFLEENIIHIECGAMISGIITKLIEHSLGGLEPLFGIPGTVGGMIYSNAGAFGSEISDFLISSTVYDIKRDRVYSLGKSELRLSYRHSLLKENKFLVLLDATLSLRQKDRDKIREEIKTVVNRRKSTQPLGFPSIGSVFKRYGDVPVAKLIDTCGLKGYRIGGAQISEKHAGFIVNIGGATADEYKSLVSYVKNEIFQKYGLRVEEEIEFLRFLPQNRY